MKAWKRLWQLINGRSPVLSDALALKAIDKMEAAQKSHISDLRILIDQSNARENQLAAMVRMVMEDRFYRPVVTRGPVNKAQAIPTEALSDVAEFDEKVDQARISADAEKERQMAEEFVTLLKEENEFRIARGMTAIVGES